MLFEKLRNIVKDPRTLIIRDPYIKINQKTHTIIDELPPLSIVDGPWIAGGAAITFYETGSFANIKDIDIFSTNEAQFFKYAKLIGQLGGARKRDEPSFYGGTNYVFNYKDHEINLIGFNYGATPAICLEDFDFDCCRVATDGHQVVTTRKAIKDNQKRILSFHDIDKQLEKQSVKKINDRIQKYMDKGYKPDKHMTHWLLANV